MTILRMTAALALATCVALGAPSVSAGEGGSFRMLMSGVADYAAVDHGDARITAGGLSGTMSVIRSSGGVFPEGANYLAECVAYATVSGAGTNVRSACEMTDVSGDRWFALATREAGDVKEGSGGGGRWQLVGGTGAYAGVSADCPYETWYLPGGRVVTTTECDWRRD